MSSLLDGIAKGIDPPMTLVKFEGDAVFAVATTDATPHGEAMVDCVRACYGNFIDRLDEVGLVWTCTCDACSRKNALDLKFIIHHGDYFVQAIGDHVDVLGPDITTAHRLLKNSAAESVDSSAYALFTKPAVVALALPLADAQHIEEPVEGMEPVAARVIALHAQS
jgi:class 3 adenylate cyclase